MWISHEKLDFRHLQALHAVIEVSFIHIFCDNHKFVMTKSSLGFPLLFLFQPAGGSGAVHWAASSLILPLSLFPFICLSLHLSLLVFLYRSLAAVFWLPPYFSTPYSSNPSIPHSPFPVCVCMNVCEIVPGGRSCAAAAEGRETPEPTHRDTTQTDLSKTHTEKHTRINPQIRSALHAQCQRPSGALTLRSHHKDEPEGALVVLTVL